MDMGNPKVKGQISSGGNYTPQNSSNGTELDLLGWGGRGKSVEAMRTLLIPHFMGSRNRGSSRGTNSSRMFTIKGEYQDWNKEVGTKNSRGTRVDGKQ